MAELEKTTPFLWIGENMNERNQNVAIACLLVLVLTPNFALAYVDPGMGSLIIQAAIAGMAGASLFFRETIGKFLKALFKKK